MDILLTGNSGFLGKIIFSELVNIDNNILTLSRTKGLIKLDLSKKIPTINSKVDIVIHASGKAHSIATTKHEEMDFFKNNVTGTQNLLSGLELSSIPMYFIFISSVAVYGLDSGLNINEQSPLIAKDSYGLSKIQAENVIIDWCNKNNVICTILRLPLLVGPNPPGNLGNMVRAIRKGYYFNIGRGTSQKSMVLAEDVARFIPIIAPIGGVYNLTDGVHPNFEKLSTALAKKKTFNLPLLFARILGNIGDLFGKNFPINTLKIKKITSNLTFDDSKARSIGWKSQSVLDYLKNNDL